MYDITIKTIVIIVSNCPVMKSKRTEGCHHVSLQKTQVESYVY